MLLFCVGTVLLEFWPEYNILTYFILHPIHVVDARKDIRSEKHMFQYSSLTFPEKEECYEV